MRLSTEQQLRLQWTPMGMMHPQVCTTCRPCDAEQLCAKQSAGCVPQFSNGCVLQNSGLFCSVVKGELKLPQGESFYCLCCSALQLQQKHMLAQADANLGFETRPTLQRKTASVAFKGRQLCWHQLLTRHPQHHRLLGRSSADGWGDMHVDAQHGTHAQLKARPVNALCSIGSSAPDLDAADRRGTSSAPQTPLP